MAEPQGIPAPLEVFFSPTQGPGTLRNRLAQEIRDARRTIDVALYTGMTAETARVVAARASSGCRVRILVDADALACDAEGKARADDPENGPRWHLILSEAGVPLRVMTPVATGGGERPAFHHKFAVIDAGTVLTGSWNWSAKGDGANYENLVVIRDAPFARRFEEEFERLWAQAGTEAASGVPSGAGKRSVSPKSRKGTK
jgi:phosphatidylserine/phosphatidylglycerophosphate/cardiolipin synthase-like enzyme